MDGAPQRSQCSQIRVRSRESVKFSGWRTVSLRPGDRTLRAPNMTLHFMPALWFEDWGLKISESIRITEIGVETLASCRRKSRSRPGPSSLRPSARSPADVRAVRTAESALGQCSRVPAGAPVRQNVTFTPTMKMSERAERSLWVRWCMISPSSFLTLPPLMKFKGA